MSEEHEQQAVIENEPDEQAKPVSEGADAQDDDLDKILAEYDAAESVEAEAKPEQGSGDDYVKSELQALRQQFEQQKYQADMASLVGKVRGEIPAEVFDDIEVEAWIDAQARREPKLQKAWMNRHNDPKGFDRVAAGLGKKFAKKFASLPDPAATEDREAVSHAVRGSSSKAPEGGGTPDFARMSDAEAREAMKKMGISDPGF